tara:strand:+ start:850 stop:978 length:129 start_codon:yes stop_codon:yes gene_type:complete
MVYRSHRREVVVDRLYLFWVDAGEKQIKKAIGKPDEVKPYCI